MFFPAIDIKRNHYLHWKSININMFIENLQQNYKLVQSKTFILSIVLFNNLKQGRSFEEDRKRQSRNQPTNQSIKKSTNQSINQSRNQLCFRWDKTLYLLGFTYLTWLFEIWILNNVTSLEYFTVDVSIMGQLYGED